MEIFYLIAYAVVIEPIMLFLRLVVAREPKEENQIGNCFNYKFCLCSALKSMLEIKEIILRYFSKYIDLL